MHGGPEQAKLVIELEKHEREVPQKLKLTGPARIAALDPHGRQLRVLSVKLRGARLLEESARCQKLLNRVRTALVNDWAETRK